MSKVTWFELPAKDAGATQKFYSDIFDWKTDDIMITTAPSDEYGIPNDRGAINGSFVPSSQLQQPIFYITVDDIDATLAKIEAAGGKTVQTKQAVPELYGQAAKFADRDGNVVGLWQND